MRMEGRSQSVLQGCVGNIFLKVFFSILSVSLFFSSFSITIFNFSSCMIVWRLFSLFDGSNHPRNKNFFPNKMLSMHLHYFIHVPYPLSVYFFNKKKNLLFSKPKYLFFFNLFFIFFAEVIKSKGLEHITVEELVAAITPRGRGMWCIFYDILFLHFFFIYCSKFLLLFDCHSSHLPYFFPIFLNLATSFLKKKNYCMYIYIYISATVPDDVRAELLTRIRKFLANN